MVTGEIYVSNSIFCIYAGLDDFSAAVVPPAGGEPAALHDNCLTVRAPVESGFITLEVRTSDDEAMLQDREPYVLEVDDGELHVAVLFNDVPDSLQTLVVEPGSWDVTIGRASDSDADCVVGLSARP